MASRVDVVLCACAGVVGFALSIVGGLLAGEFDTALGGSPSAVIDFYAGTAFDAQFVTGVILETSGLLLLMAFAVGLVSLMQGSPYGEWLGRVVGAMATVATTLAMVSVSTYAAGTFRASHGGLVSDGYVVLSDVRQLAYRVSLPAWALVFLISGALMARRRSFSTWLGWAAVIIGVAHVVVPFIDSVEVWDGATGLGGLWFVVTAGYMLARPDRYSLPTSEPPSPHV